jgi:hypothetical protein
MRMSLCREDSDGVGEVDRRADGNGGGILTVLTTEEGKVAMVHSDVAGYVGEVSVKCDG